VITIGLKLKLTDCALGTRDKSINKFVTAFNVIEYDTVGSRLLNTIIINAVVLEPIVRKPLEVYVIIVLYTLLLDKVALVKEKEVSLGFLSVTPSPQTVANRFFARLFEVEEAPTPPVPGLYLLYK
jgi:hypothetical protein